MSQASHTLGFALYLLAKNPKVQLRLQEEVDSVVGNSHEITASHIREMPYLKNVLKETLRYIVVFYLFK